LSGDVIDVSYSPFNITVVYVLVGGAWIALSDRLVDALLQPGEVYVLVQTTKGWAFVAGSALLLYALMSQRERRLQRTNERLEGALQQVTILHRVVRHNLRNVCNVILGNVELLEEEFPDSDRAECIRTQTEALVEMSETTHHLRTFVLEEEPTTARVDAVEMVTAQVERARREHPDAQFNLDLPETAAVTVVSQFELAVAELLENAVEHNDAAEPTVWVAVKSNVDGTTTIDVADDGPGLPEMEEELLERGIEKPLFHSEGLGLWLVRILVTESGGSLRVVDNEPEGTVVRVTLGGESTAAPASASDGGVATLVRSADQGSADL
jgi:two-component system OmpR family sensor kinase